MNVMINKDLNKYWSGITQTFSRNGNEERLVCGMEWKN